MPQHPYEKSFQKLDPDTVSDQAAISTAGNEQAELSGVSNLERLLGVSYVNEAAADFQPGDSVGDCQIVRFLAEGGMGRVYEARQRRPNRIVAVKLIRPHRLTQAAIHRFNYEAEVLGRLQHPSIAQIFSAGIEKRKSEEIPFLVMEFVPDSLSMTSYARVHSLTIGERVNLFLAACAGLAYAHRNGVLHRDLKPKNIIVGDTGAVKVIDFGVSRLVRGGNGLPANDTATGELVGTLQAMSPEQVSATASEIGTPTDVYALGLILYELLANRRAYDCHSESLEAVIKRIQEFNPPA
jgi:serine/threonine protein kinase